MTYPMSLDWTQKKVLDFFREHVTRGTLIFRVDDKHEVVLGDGQEPKAAMTIPMPKAEINQAGRRTILISGSVREPRNNSARIFYDLK